MKSLVFVLVYALIFSACSGSKTTGKTEAEVLYKQALESFNDERYLIATEKLGQLKSQYPYSYYATHAELLQADILFNQKSYVEATAAYLMFRDAHPKHEKLSYVIFRIGESYYKQLPSTFDRDLSAAGEAIKYFDETIERYPNSEYAPQAQTYKDECSQMLLNKEKYIADFYYKTNVFDAALWRYLDIIQNIKDKSLRDHAKVRAVLSSYKMGSFGDCINFSKSFLDELTGSDKQQVLETQEICSKLKQEQDTKEGSS